MNASARSATAVLLLAGGILLAAVAAGSALAEADPTVRALRLFLLASGFVAALRSPPVAMLAVLVAACVGHAPMRLLLDSPASAAEHLFCGAAPLLALRAWRGAAAEPRSHGRPLERGSDRFARLARGAAFTLGAVVVASFARILVEYAGEGIPPAAFLADALPRHFAFSLGDVSRDSRGVTHEALLLLEGLAFFAAMSSVRLAPRQRDAARVLAASGIVVAAAALDQHLRGWGANPFFERVQPDLERLAATFPDPNTFAAWIVLAGPLGFAALRGMGEGRGEAARGRWRTVAWIWSVAAWIWSVAAWMWTVAAWMWTVALLACLAATVSRSAWMAAAAMAFTLVATAGWKPATLGLAPEGNARRACAAASVLGPTLLVAMVATATLLDLGRDVSYKHASRPIDMLLVTANLRRPLPELLPSRVEHWRAAVSIWLEEPWFGAGIGRYRLLKFSAPLASSAPLDAPLAATSVVLLAGDGRANGSITAPAAGAKLERWVQASGGVDFARADVKAGDTLESHGAGWGPVEVVARYSPTQLIVDSAPAVAVRGGDFVVRHPRIDHHRAHAHDATSRRLPFFTQAHQNYLLLLAELGVAGLGAFLALMGSVFAAVLRGSAVAKGGDLRLAALAGIAGVLVCALAQDPLDTIDLGFVFWGIAGLALHDVEDEDGDDSDAAATTRAA